MVTVLVSFCWCLFFCSCWCKLELQYEVIMWAALIRCWWHFLYIWINACFNGL